MIRPIAYSPEAQDDFLRLYDYIAERSGAERAAAYVERIADLCDGLANFPERGRTRDDLWPGLRTASFERRVVVAFDILDGRVTIVRIFYGGRDLSGAFAESGDGS